MIAPVVIYFAVWVIGPIFYGIYLSLTNANLVRPPEFIGLANYANLFHDTAFWSSLRVTLIYAAATVVPTLVVSLLVARLIVNLRGRGFFLTLLFVPVVVPSVAAALVFGILFARYGLINEVFHLSIAWLNDPSSALYALSIVTLWGMVGYYVVIFAAGYQQIPLELTEAAILDRAGTMRRLWHIELPMLRPTLLFCSVTSVAAVLTNFGSPFVLTSGGPGNATTTLPLLIYNEAFPYSDAATAEAISVVMLAFTLILTAVQVRLIFGDRRVGRRRFSARPEKQR